MVRVEFLTHCRISSRSPNAAIGYSCPLAMAYITVEPMREGGVVPQGKDKPSSNVPKAKNLNGMTTE